MLCRGEEDTFHEFREPPERNAGGPSTAGGGKAGSEKSACRPAACTDGEVRFGDRHAVCCPHGEGCPVSCQGGDQRGGSPTCLEGGQCVLPSTPPPSNALPRTPFPKKPPAVLRQSLGGQAWLNTGLAELDLWAPATYSEVHEGQHFAWVAPGSQAAARLDCHMVPSAWHVKRGGSKVSLELDPGHLSVDHFAVQLDVHLAAPQKLKTLQKGTRLES